MSIGHMTMQDIKDELRREDPELMDASDHHFQCRCEICLRWWAMMGPDGMEPGQYGPFSTAEVNTKQDELGLELSP